ncbi:GDP-mannose-dependent alpha-(1-2)-phosphatidylinositol mannosyltransferase [Nostocoides japonicum T1-X7]|uniref:D-inositol 3-phosphate glycosyltransferase n=1 Tax=Nostocoides japonicum T1-X7 TaxID=1194083 RepID=A0A077LSM1_9MICO|nr:glycosyltransferase family 4 protein [Tetrasphaera japonica]CCH75973.1 GDP-mannose-dependent alpha-(1-2)-phosphatidylinositol mannosyltransferase [Tetrasphaera japonica T1-X7]
MRIGLVCPYSFDVPGGVQFHVRDLAEHFLRQGHVVSVLAPADEDTPLPDYVVSCGRSVPVRYNGSVARLNFGPMTSARVSRWLDEGSFDVVHVHEPLTPSISVLALRASTAPVVATFHTSNLRSRALQAAYPLIHPLIERILGRIAVSEDARRTLTSHIGGDAVVIPNGVDTGFFRTAEARREWQGADEAPTLAFVGRIEEPRKGLPVLAAAMPAILARHPRTRLFVAGPGDAETAVELLAPAVREATSFLGMVSDEDKAALLASVSAYVAPHTGGESFGIVLVEAMAAGAPVAASDLPAFLRVLGPGPAGVTFTNEDPADLARVLGDLLDDRVLREELSAFGAQRALDFDWSTVAEEIMAVYETVVDAARAVEAIEAATDPASGPGPGAGFAHFLRRRIGRGEA